jgi:hypothetical protein
MSKGLGGIGNDPQATPLTRKMLGILSTPGLLVYDDAITIDGTGRIVLRLAPDSGMFIDERGLGLSPVAETIGIDSFVDDRSEAHDRDWNARLTGPAPNFIEGSVAIGSEELGGVSAGLTAETGETPEKAKVNITSTTTQLRLSYDPSNYVAVRVLETGFCEWFSIGIDDPGFHLISGDGTINGVSGGLRLNYGTTLKRLVRLQATVSYGGGGVLGQISSYSATITATGVTFDPAKDVVSVCPIDAPPAEYSSWSVRIVSATQLDLRVMFFNVTGALAMDWNVSVLQFHS